MFSLIIVAKTTEIEVEERKEITMHTMPFSYKLLFFFIYSQTIQKSNTHTETFMHLYLVPYPYLILTVAEAT